tara:strand:- start:1697 stop:1879 length:183 start_codon:yes stop_codon:yes gene_type:complete
MPPNWGFFLIWDRGTSVNVANIYQGINEWLTFCNAFESPYWLTFHQIKEQGGQVRTGEKY